MFNDTVIETLRDIRIQLLYYWQQEKDTVRKEDLSKKLNELDNMLMKAMKINEARKNQLGGVS